MAELRLYDTGARQVRAFEPREPGRVGIYVCGPTVYTRIHIGNARPFVVFSLLKRFLEHAGYAVCLVVNVTDVNDKIYAAARGGSSVELADVMTAAYVADTDRLELGRPDHEPLASASIAEIIEEIQALLDGGYAYVAGGDVYFRVRRDGGYGALSGRDVDAMDQGEGVEGADLKEDPLDFALWKAHKAEEDSVWDAPWGRGRPGWHIECSAMAERLLGVGFDIHGGGLDLLFPHHENEAAQTRCARGAELAAHWMHNGMLAATDGEKMSKSLGNIAPLHEVLDRHGRDAVILYFVSAHYRQPIAYGEEPLAAAAAGVQRIRDAARRLAAGDSPLELRPLRERFFEALADDFNTPSALAAMWEWIREANRRAAPVGDRDLREMLGVLGLESLFDVPGPPAAVRVLAEARAIARAEGDFARADELRAQIEAAGWSVRDTPTGFELGPLA
ncbi:MAG TPA: cysteine--tRNA ligase [Solirubrobacteraceae bacterium]|nr:cysteine--tRNA ligase [Solirubrobacteraceae bacterium]